tara:strand:- start:57 stop:233 length:177 start_codon:yes stop_codon:yes gene_type:complete
MNEQMRKLRLEIQGTLQCEKNNLEAYDPTYSDPDMKNCEGWIEALEYVLRQIHEITEE